MQHVQQRVEAARCAATDVYARSAQKVGLVMPSLILHWLDALGLSLRSSFAFGTLAPDPALSEHAWFVLAVFIISSHSSQRHQVKNDWYVP